MQRLGIRHLWLLVPFFALAVRASLAIGDNSFLWHVRAGVDQLASGEVFRADPYSFTMGGEPWRTQSWLAELLYGAAENAFGDLAWVAWFNLLVGAMVLGGAIALLMSRGGSPTSVALIAILFGWILQPYANPRPVLFSYLLFVLLALVVTGEGRRLWAVPGIMWVWAAVHGSFVIGIGLLVLDAIRLRSRRHLVAVGLSLVAVSATAHGLGVWEILYRFAINRDGLEVITEWAAPDFLSVWLLPFVVALGLLMVGLSLQRIPLRDLWIILPVVTFGMVSSRNVLPAMILLLPWLADATASLRAGDDAGRGGILPIATAGLVVAASVLVVATAAGLNEERFPSPEAVAALADAPAFHTMGPGGYLIYADADRQPVFVDDRVELYGGAFLREYLDAAFGVEYEPVFAEWGIEQALLGNDSDLLKRLHEDGWTECYADEWFTVVAAGCP